MDQIGKLMVIGGLVLAGFGGLIWLGSRVSWLRLGRLPGDIAIERDGFGFYFPITTMLLLSGLLTLIIWLYNVVRR